MTRSRPPILLLGATGQIGRELMRALETRPEAGDAVIALGRRQLDLRDEAGLRRRVREIAPRVVINAAGYTAVDRAEEEPEIASAVNARRSGWLAEEAARCGAALVHYSTDYVFDGASRAPYRPGDPPAPINAYGRTKHEGERAIAGAGAPALILRTSWVYGHRGRNFLDAILRRAESGDDLRVVDDQRGCPTWSRLVAEATAKILLQTLEQRGARWSFGGREGTYHLAATGETTWFDFARRIVACAGIDPPPRLSAVSTEAYGAAAARPAYSVLDSSAAREVFGVEIGDWKTPVDEVVRLWSQRTANPLPESPR